jgi:hypothetical protein
MNRSLRYITIIVLCSLCTAAGNGQTPSHREIFFRLTDSLMTDAAAATADVRSVALNLSDDSLTVFFGPMLIHGLASHNVPFMLGKDSSDAVLTLTVRGSAVSFGETFSESFLGTRKTERTVGLTVIGTLVSRTNGALLWSREFSRSLTDVVPESETEQLQTGMPLVTTFSRSDRSFFDSLLEPVIVTIASGIAIYLFFTIRS